MTRAASSNQLFKMVLIQGGLLVATIAVVGGLLGWFLVGAGGLASALIGAGLTLVFNSFTAISVWLGAKLPLGGFFGLVLGGWVLKLIGFVAIIALLRGAEFIHGPTFFFTLIASILGTLAIDSVAVLRSRIPVVN